MFFRFSTPLEPTDYNIPIFAIVNDCSLKFRNAELDSAPLFYNSNIAKTLIEFRVTTTLKNFDFKLKCVF